MNVTFTQIARRPMVVRVDATRTEVAGTGGYGYEVLADDTELSVVCSGWAAGSRAHVREEAKVHAHRVLNVRAKAAAAAITGDSE